MTASDGESDESICSVWLDRLSERNLSLGYVLELRRGAPSVTARAPYFF